MPTPEDVRAAVRSYGDALATKDKERWLSRFAADAVQVDPVGSEPNVGHEAIGAFWDATIAPAERLAFDLQRLVVCGKEAAVAFTMEVRSDHGGMAIDIIDVMVFDDDARICELRAYWDPGEVRVLG